MTQKINREYSTEEVLLYGGIAVGVLLGAAAATFVWRRRVRALEEMSPIDRAEGIINNVESKLASIEESLAKIEENSS